VEGAILRRRQNSKEENTKKKSRGDSLNELFQRCLKKKGGKNGSRDGKRSDFTKKTRVRGESL